MKVLLLTLVLAVVMVANSVAKPTKVSLPSELLEEIKSKGVEIFQEYLKWKDALQPGSNTRFRTFLENLWKERELTKSVAEAEAAEKREEAEAEVAEDNLSSEDDDGDEPTETVIDDGEK